MEYFAFGETFVEEHSNTHRTPYLFNGKELDEETGLYYYGARYYDGRASIFLSVDPLAEKYVFQSPYVYAANNPINFVDAMGMGPELPPSHIVNKIKNFNPNIYDALWYSNNTSNLRLYQLSQGNLPNEYNKLKGAVGEAIALERLRDDNIIGGLIGNAHIRLGVPSLTGQVDVTGIHWTGDAGSYLKFKVRLGVRSYNFDGTEGKMAVYGSSKPKIYWVNYEVKTLNENSGLWKENYDRKPAYTAVAEGLEGQK